MITFNLRLGDTYWSKGFFNVSVDFERYLTTTDGPIDIFLGHDSRPLVGRISRTANKNATPRIFGNKPLAEFFQKNFPKSGFVSVEIVSPEAIRIGARSRADTALVKPAGSEPKVQARIPTAAPAMNRVELPRVSSDATTDIHGLYGHLARFCEALWKRQQKAPTPSDFASLISGLERQDVVPSLEASMMHTVRKVRNSHVHDHRRLGSRENRVVAAAWEVIAQWAEGQHMAVWRSTKNLPG